MLLGRAIKCTQQCPALHPGSLLNRIDANRPHRCEVDHESVIRDRLAEHAVSAAPHADLEVEIARRSNGCLHVRGIAAASDEAWPPVDHRVPHRARRVIARISRHQHVAIECLRQACADHGSAGRLVPTRSFA
jgi:hypothetical protein